MSRLGGLLVLLSLLVAGPAATAADPSKLKGLKLGEYVFLTYCSGCHGFDGLAFFPGAPSFAMGDRLLKGDAELMRSILKGRDAMPSWESKLPRVWLDEALGYLRHIAKGGLKEGNRPEYYYIFTPMGTEMDLNWHIPPP